MSPAVHGAQLFLLAWFIFLGVGSLLSGAIVRVMRRWLSAGDPQARYRAIVLVAALPLLTAAAFLFAVSLPSLAGIIVPALDHCAHHDDGHAHLCFVHPPRSGINSWMMLGLVFLLVYAALRAALASFGMWHATRVVETLANTGQPLREAGVTIIDTAHPVCLTVGLFRPRVLMSRGLFESLSDNERAVVIAHERAHVSRHDAFVGAVARFLAAFHLPRVGRWLVHELEVAAEQACDEEAVAEVGNRVAVAATILAVERATQRTQAGRFGPVAVAFGERSVERRVEALLREPACARSFFFVGGSLGIGLLGVLALSPQLHHLTESFLSALAH